MNRTDEVFQGSYTDLLENNDCYLCGRPTEFDFKVGGYFELCEECKELPVADDDQENQ